jgi:hypothetical protein
MGRTRTRSYGWFVVTAEHMRSMRMKLQSLAAPETVASCDLTVRRLETAVVLALELGPDVDVRIGFDIAVLVNDSIRPVELGPIALVLGARRLGECIDTRSGVDIRGRSRSNVTGAEVGIIRLGKGRRTKGRSDSHRSKKPIDIHLHLHVLTTLILQQSRSRRSVGC